MHPFICLSITVSQLTTYVVARLDSLSTSCWDSPSTFAWTLSFNIMPVPSIHIMLRLSPTSCLDSLPHHSLNGGTHKPDTGNAYRQLGGGWPTTPSATCWTWMWASTWKGALELSRASWREVRPLLHISMRQRDRHPTRLNFFPTFTLDCPLGCMICQSWLHEGDGLQDNAAPCSPSVPKSITKENASSACCVPLQQQATCAVLHCT